MRAFRRTVWTASVVICCVLPAFVPAAEITILSEKTWDEFVPRGKEVDAIYGDFVLRNGQIVVVVANPVPGRHANMDVQDVGGCIIDLTVRERQSDQLSAYYPGARRFPYQLEAFGVAGNGVIHLPDGREERGEAIGFRAHDGRLDGPFNQTEAAVLCGDQVHLECVSPATADRPEVRLRYALHDRASQVEIRTEFINNSDEPLTVVAADDFRADRTFQTSKRGKTELVWFYDKSWGQAYGVVAERAKMRLTGRPAAPRVIEFLIDSDIKVELAPGQKVEMVRRLFPGGDLVAVKATAARLGDPQAALAPFQFVVQDGRDEAVPAAELELARDGEPYGSARTRDDGTVCVDLPVGSYDVKVSAFARGEAKSKMAIGPELASGRAKHPPHRTKLPAAPRVLADITDADGKPVPCKVQFIGVAGTENPFFFDDTGEHAVRNLYYSHNGRFAQEIPPGTYDVLISRGPEYDMEKQRIEAKPGEDVSLRATLTRVVQSPGWVSADFHSHSTPSGDTAASQLGRVLNHLCEHIEFAPCTEHNRLDTYVPHLKALGVEHLMGTCTGIELTNLPFTVNHQNAFPLIMKPRTQDNGAPEEDEDPELQIKRLALWDNNSDKLVQQNHPDIGELFFDRDGDGQPDGGFKGMFAYQDVIEVQPIYEVLNLDPLRYVVDKPTKAKTTHQSNNTVFNWLQLLNQGRRLPGVVNSDAHYNFHGSGFIRNYVKCETDDPSQIDPLDIVHAAEQGHIIMTNGPFLEVALYDSDAGAARVGGKRRTAIPGDEIALPGGFGTLHVRVQCPNWFDIDRVQVLRNGRKDEKLNWTRSANQAAFLNGVVKFERRIPIEFKTDTHLIVVAAGENSQIGPVMGPEHGKMQPTAISNPIFVDADGGGFKANGDTLGHPLPVKQHKPRQENQDR